MYYGEKKTHADALAMAKLFWRHESPSWIVELDKNNVVLKIEQFVPTEDDVLEKVEERLDGERVWSRNG